MTPTMKENQDYNISVFDNFICAAEEAEESRLIIQNYTFY